MSQPIEYSLLKAFLDRRGCVDEDSYIKKLMLDATPGDPDPVVYEGNDAPLIFPFGFAQLPVSCRNALEQLIDKKGTIFLGADMAPMRATRDKLQSGDYSEIFNQLIGFAGHEIADPFLIEFYRQRALILRAENTH